MSDDRNNAKPKTKPASDEGTEDLDVEAHGAKPVSIDNEGAGDDDVEAHFMRQGAKPATKP